MLWDLFLSVNCCQYTGQSRDRQVDHDCAILRNQQQYAPRIPWETKEEKLKKYHNSIEKVFAILEKQEEKSEEKKTLEKFVGNFGLYLQTMFRIIPEKKSTLQKSDLEKIVINNEYDVQHIMYAVIKALYPSARREVNQDMGMQQLDMIL